MSLSDFGSSIQYRPTSRSRTSRYASARITSLAVSWHCRVAWWPCWSSWRGLDALQRREGQWTTTSCYSGRSMKVHSIQKYILLSPLKKKQSEMHEGSYTLFVRKMAQKSCNHIALTISHGQSRGKHEEFSPMRATLHSRVPDNVHAINWASFIHTHHSFHTLAKGALLSEQTVTSVSCRMESISSCQWINLRELLRVEDFILVLRFQRRAPGPPLQVLSGGCP